MKNLLLIAGFLIMGINAQAGIDKGNGGSGSESMLVGQQAQIESVALKLRLFFLKNEASLQPIFPEFNIQALIKKIKVSDVRVVDEDKLIDKYGKSRTCLNFPDSSLIECKSSDIEPLFDQPTALFVLVLHEYLGLIGAEETSPSNPTMIAGYSISKRIAPFVSKVNDYDLVIPKKIEVVKRSYCDVTGLETRSEILQKISEDLISIDNQEKDILLARSFMSLDDTRNANVEIMNLGDWQNFCSSIREPYLK